MERLALHMCSLRYLVNITVANCWLRTVALLDKSIGIAYNVIINLASTDKGRPIERWGRKATGLR